MMNLTRLIILTALLPLTCWAEEASQRPPTNGYSCVFLGHSFFVPIAKAFGQHPARCGFPAHKQLVVFHGGTGGTPGRLWVSPAEDVRQAKELIATGTIDLVGLTYHSDMGSDLADYRRWIDYSRQHNPHTRFFIMAPWPRYQGRTLAAYEAAWQKLHAAIHGLIDQLRQACPRTTIFCIPQGQWMVELWRLFARNELPEISDLMRPNKESRASCLFMDHLGHGGPVPVQTGALLWLAIIYGVDVRDGADLAGARPALQKLAWDIAQGDPDAKNDDR